MSKIMELYRKAAEEHKWQNWANPQAPFHQALQAEVSRMEAELAECKAKLARAIEAHHGIGAKSCPIAQQT